MNDKNKKILKEGVVDKLFSLFLKSKSQGKESKWISKIRETDPNLADMWLKWDNEADELLQLAKRNYTAAGKPEKAKNIDNIISKYKNM